MMLGRVLTLLAEGKKEGNIIVGDEERLQELEAKTKEEIKKVEEGKNEDVS